MTTVQVKPQHMSFWGATWRLMSLTLLIIAALFATVFGMEYGIKYVQSLSLGEGMKLALSLLVNLVGFVLAYFVIDKLTAEVSDVIDQRGNTELEEEMAARTATA